MRAQTTKLMAAMLALVCQAATGRGDDYVTYRESWVGGGAKGWHEASGWASVSGTTLGLDGASLGLRFPAQPVALPEIDSFVADGGSSGGLFVGDYVSGSNTAHSIAFDFLAQTVLPSALWFLFQGSSGGSTNTFMVSVGQGAQATGEWCRITVPLRFEATNWITSASAGDFSNALTNVEKLEVRVVRSGTQPQLYALDRFSLTIGLPADARETDSDGDGLPDYWETKHFDGPTNAVPLVDSDGDSISNAGEYMAGTNPRDPSSYFSIEQVRRTGSRYGLLFDTFSGRRYDLGWIDGDIHDPWQWLTNGLDGDGHYRWLYHTNGTEHGFYRVRVTLPE